MSRLLDCIALETRTRGVAIERALMTALEGCHFLESLPKLVPLCTDGTPAKKG